MGGRDKALAQHNTEGAEGLSGTPIPAREAEAFDTRMQTYFRYWFCDLEDPVAPTQPLYPPDDVDDREPPQTRFQFDSILAFADWPSS